MRNARSSISRSRSTWYVLAPEESVVIVPFADGFVSGDSLIRVLHSVGACAGNCTAQKKAPVGWTGPKSFKIQGAAILFLVGDRCCKDAPAQEGPASRTSDDSYTKRCPN